MEHFRKNTYFWAIRLYSPLIDKQISLVPAFLLGLFFNPTVLTIVNSAVSSYYTLEARKNENFVPSISISHTQLRRTPKQTVSMLCGRF
jgi:hypothetical protein